MTLRAQWDKAIERLKHFGTLLKLGAAKVATEEEKKLVQLFEQDLALVESCVARTVGWGSDQAAYAVYHQVHGWLTDTCAGGTWSKKVAEAIWFNSAKLAVDTINEAELPCAEGRRYFVLQVQ